MDGDELSPRSVRAIAAIAAAKKEASAGAQVSPFRAARTLAGDEGIVVEAVPWGAADIPARTEYVEAVGLGNHAVDSRRLRFEDLFVHFEFAEVRGLVAESFKHRSRIRQGETQRRHKVVLHLIENTDDLRWLAGEERRSGRRAHGGRDVRNVTP